jgi:Alkyl hydroperoxide reductase, large subunit
MQYMLGSIVIYCFKKIAQATGSNAKLAQTIGLKKKDGREKYVKTVIESDEAGHTNINGIWAAGVSVHTIVTSGDGAKKTINADLIRRTDH